MIKHVQDFKHKKVVVVGDIMLDAYTFGDVTRVSPEAPVPVLKKHENKYVLGGAANVAHNAGTLGSKVVLCGVVGNDGERETVLKLLAEHGIGSSGIVVDERRPTTVKHRFITNGHQLFRADTESTDVLSPEAAEHLYKHIEVEMSGAHVVVLSDYAKGVFSHDFTRRVIDLAKQKGIKIVADIKPANKEFFKGVDLITPNFKEAKEITGLSSATDIARELLRGFSAAVFITMSADGIYAADQSGASELVPTQKVKVYDVSGAGDTVTAVAALGVASGLDIVSLAKLANLAGNIVVQKPGTATVSAEELIAHLAETNHVDGVAIVPKLWGYEKWLENNDQYCSKILSINRGYQCSLHYHKIKDEMFLVTKGYVRVELGSEIMFLRPGNFVRVTPGVPHRFRGMEDSEILEISTHHEESDSYRIEESRKVEEMFDSSVTR